ncbi:MAG: ribbon-helix-helix domain-containing protein [Alphaproteobacteria bacterium]|uniref:Ribbon-helix-helix domain-containing protein n=1 Tax=Peteryoungia algae TaxID=2919917 RepID=A0ABT0D4I7_9HYPH|nr:ribbon-helix-helix domain-containing protein [Rhizobium sp. SSM4.3]MBU2329056.1 ribbon-helix-helix domain-containing protein [Alphaproteobacteria bacterium]MCJ8240323.1 ribbon-helix-helix domain-containing protein [Rhizobium sp. SSM4.3]
MPEAKQSESVTLRVPSDILADVDRIAGGTERSRSYIILRALKAYLVQEGADILGAIEGRMQLDAGEHEDFDVVLAEMNRIIAGKVA